MPELDLGPAIEAAAKAAYSAATFHTAPWDDLAPAARKTWLRESRIHITAALPELERVIGERLAQRIEAAVRHDRNVNPVAYLVDKRDVALREAAAIVRGQGGDGDGS